MKLLKVLKFHRMMTIHMKILQDIKINKIHMLKTNQKKKMGLFYGQV